MKREFDRLREGPLDVLVVGGGIYGAWTAYDAALRGFRTALIDKGDWAGATSSASSKLIHGGLRYLEHGHLGLVRKTLDERRRLARIGPHRVVPLRFLFPVYRGDRVGRFRMRLGLWFYDRLAGRGQPVPPHRALGRAEMSKMMDLREDGLRGGFTFGDCRTDDAKFTLEIVDGAHGAGVAAVNRALATRLIVEDGGVRGAVIEDVESGGSVELRARQTVCSAGPWVSSLSATAVGAQPLRTRLTKGVHLVLPGLESEDALVISSNDDARIVFLIPWYGRTLLGTTDTDHDGDPGEIRVEPQDVGYLLERVDRVLREPRWTQDDVIGAFAGVRTLPASDAANPSDVTREWSMVEPLPGLTVSLGGKYTSARSDAAKIVDRLARIEGRDAVDPPTAERPMPWCPTEPFGTWLTGIVREAEAAGIDTLTARQCAHRYGSRFERILERVRATPDLARRIVADAPFCRAEIVHAVEMEMARSLEDVLRRRIPLLLVSRVDDLALRDAADLAGDVLDWDGARRIAEVRALDPTRFMPVARP